MKPVLWIPACCALALALSSCGNTGSSSGGQQSSTGPFDRNGRYIDEWADNPSKWRKSGSTPSPHEINSDDVPQIASNDQPPANSNPLAAGNSSKPTLLSKTTTTKTTTTKTTPVIAQSEISSKPRPTTQSKPAVRSSEATAVKAKPREEPVAKAKPKPKPVVKAKPKSTRYVVKAGDSLSAIASRNGTSVSALKSANDISGSMIHPGQSLTIPKR